MQKLNESDLKRKPSDVFELSVRLGKGSYGVVYMAKHRDSGETVAVKKVPVDSDLSDIVKEISIMQQCNSQYIVRYYGSYFDDYALWICMEYCGAGSVSDIMRWRCKTMQEDQMATILHHCLLGLDYLHDLNKIHRDIKAGNILLNMEGHAKLADFGVAGQLSDTLAKRNTVIGTPYWMAPEVIQEIGYNFSADIWSLGITAIEMADGKPPYVDVHPMRALFMIPYSNAPTVSNSESYSTDFNYFLAECLVKDPDKRSTSKQLLKHPFISSSKPCVHLKEMIREAMECKNKRDSTSSNSLPTDGNTESGTNRLSDTLSGPTNVGDTMTEDDGKTMILNVTLSENEATMISMRTSSEKGAESLLRHPSTSSNSSYADTMVINAVEDEEENDGTLTTSRYKPAFMEKLGINQKKVAANSKNHRPEFGGKVNNNQINIENIYLPFPRRFQDGGLEDLSMMSTEELRKQLDSLDLDLKRELDSLAIRYQHKRQPILDSINEKIKQNSS